MLDFSGEFYAHKLCKFDFDLIMERSSLCKLVDTIV